MPLTAAQKQKQYREKMRIENPEKFEIAKKKNAERNKKRKKIADCDDTEKEKQRKEWRARKAKQKQHMTNNTVAITTTRNETEALIENAKLAERRKNQRHWNTERKQFEDKIKDLRNKIKSMRKQTKRLQKKNEKLLQTIEEIKIQSVENIEIANPRIENVTTPKDMTPLTKSVSFINDNLPNIPQEKIDIVKKQLICHNVLVQSLKNTYEKAKTNNDKNVLKEIVSNEVVQKYRSKVMMAGYLGLKGKIRRYAPKKKKQTSLIELKSFFERDDVSRATAGKKEYRTHKKNKKQIRYLLSTLRDLYKKYKEEGGKLKFAMFKKYRPFYVLPPKITNRETCGCKRHENIILKYKVLKSFKMIQSNDIKEIAAEIVCDVSNKDCAYGDCTKCNNNKLKLDWEGKDCAEIVSWEEWELRNHEYYDKKDANKLRVTKRMVKTKKRGDLKHFTGLFEKELQEFKKHVYNIKHQYYQYSMCLKNMTDQEAAIHIDFSENWICKLHTEIQAMHFGASQVQTTIHTGVLYLKNNSPQSFASISPSNEHGPEAIWAHLSPILRYLKNRYPLVTTIHFFSDGPTSQYRQKKNFYFFSKITRELEFKNCTWNFSESSHGKGAADGVGGAIKRKLDSYVSHGTDVPDALTAFNLLRDSDSSIMIFYIPHSDIEFYQAPSDLKPIPGTMLLHQVLNTEIENVIQYRSLSCFCSSSCQCLDLKSHSLIAKGDSHEKELSNDDESTTNINRSLKRKINQKPSQKLKQKRKKTFSSSTEDEEDEDIKYVDTDDDSDVTYYSEESNDEPLILDEKTGFVITKPLTTNNADRPVEMELDTNKESQEVLRSNLKIKIIDNVSIAIDRYALVKFNTNKTIRHYVGKILEINGLYIKINFMRMKSNGKFYWPQIEDISEVFTNDIVKVLNIPVSVRRGYTEFEDNLSEYKID